MAMPYERFGSANPATRMVPATAVPSDEPRSTRCATALRSLSLQALGERGLHDVDRRRQHDARDQSRSRRDRREVPGAGMPFHQDQEHHDPDQCDDEPVAMRARWRNRLASARAASEDNRTPDRRRGEDHAGLDGVVVANDLEIGGDGEGRTEQDRPLHVLRHQSQVRRAVVEQRSREQGFAALRSRRRIHMMKPPSTRAPSTIRPAISARLWSAAMIPPTRMTSPAAERMRPRRRMGASDRVARGRPARRARATITTMTSAWKMKAARQVMVVVITPPMSGPMAAPIPPIALITPKAHARDFKSVNEHGGEDVDRRDQQGRAHALEDRVPRISTPRPGESALSTAPMP